MKIKYAGVLLIIFLLIIMGFLLFNNFSTQNTVKVGDANFLLPNGYKEDGVNKFGALTITNGTNQFYIIKHDDSNVSRHISEYEKLVKEKNESMTIKNITMSNTIFYKTNNIDNPQVVHYWFVKNGNTYEIYKYNENNEFESQVMYLYNHMT